MMCIYKNCKEPTEFEIRWDTGGGSGWCRKHTAMIIKGEKGIGSSIEQITHVAKRSKLADYRKMRRYGRS